MIKIPKKIFSPGNIIGLGESSHGSSTETTWKHNLILKYIRENKDNKFIFYFEAYENPIRDLMTKIQDHGSLPTKSIEVCLSQLYKIWQTQEIYDFFLSLISLVINEKIKIEIFGVDFKDANVKKNLDKTEILSTRHKIIFNNIKKNYDEDAVHFFSAHNTHVGKYNKVGQIDVGGFLKNHFNNKYISIAQHTSAGSIRAKKTNNNYGVVEFSFSNIPNSVTSLSKKIFKNSDSKKTIIISTSDPICSGINIIEQAGFFWPLKKPWLMEMGEEYFDYLVIHRESVATNSLLD